MAKLELKYSITEVTVSSGKTAMIQMEVDGQIVRVPVSPEIRAYFNEQFVRPNPTPTQRKRFGTLMNLLRAAYKKGMADGQK